MFIDLQMLPTEGHFMSVDDFISFEMLEEGLTKEVILHYLELKIIKFIDLKT